MNFYEWWERHKEEDIRISSKYFLASKAWDSATAEASAKIAELEKERQWIPVSERLPKNERNVLIWSPESYHMIDSYSEELGWIESKSWGIKPTYWMPLPEPPAKES